MEREYKWMLPRENMAQLAGYLRETGKRLSSGTVHMQAVYYDTENEDCRKMGAALRIRRENDRSVCCLKQTVSRAGALAEREEYETEAKTLEEGLTRLPDAGAPADLCLFLRHQSFTELARTDFIRSCYLLHIAQDEGTFTAELAVDIGYLGNSGRTQRFEEIELELKAGSTKGFTQFAEALQTRFALTPQPLSKLARARAVRAVPASIVPPWTAQ